MSENTAEVALDTASSNWAELGVSTELLSTLKRQGIDTPFPIQAKTLPDAISGRDVLGRGQTGSGKTLAFGLAMVTRLAHRKATAKHPLGIVLVPTRELAMQVTDALMPYAQAVELDIRLIAGGMPYAKQIDALKRGVPIVVATPGRLNDLVEQGHINLSKIEITILDEADQMCDMGFMPQIVEVLDLTKPGSQRLLFSATLDKDVDKIVKKYLKNPIEHATNSVKASVTTMTHYLFITYSEDKPTILAEIGSRKGKTMFFARTQAGVDRIAKDLANKGVPAGALHGGKTQAVRTRTLAAFKEGLTNVLVATDVAARGIHVDGVSLVVHIDPPNDHKDYLHRAGRTARAGETGKVVTMIGPRQQKAVTAMTNRAGVDPEVVKVKPMSKELVSITGAKEPTGIAWKPPAEPPKRGGRPSGGRSGGGRPSGGRSGGSRGGNRTR
jgi:superfamily II DNA/RNA helicase